MPASQFLSWFTLFHQQSLLHNERRLIVLRGDECWASELLQPILNDSAFISAEKTHLSYGENAKIATNVPAKRYRDKLGTESHIVTFTISGNISNKTSESDNNFNVDAFAALSGTLVAGGIFILILPCLEKQTDDVKQSLFLQRLLSKVSDYPEHVVIEQNDIEQNNSSTIFTGDEKYDLLIEDTQQSNSNKETLAHGCATAEQLQAVKAIEKVFTGHRNRPLILTADRGRGKSSALAIACANLIKKNAQKKPHCQALTIIISASDIQSLAVFFRQIQQSLPDAKLITNKAKTKVEHLGGCIEFIPIDVLIKQQPKASLLLIDEAAAIPVYLLSQLLSCYHRIVFSSTVHGYEGAGRGFTLKFQQILHLQCPQWQLLHINQAIRWRENDPLEQFVFDACLLNAVLSTLSEADFSASECKVSDLVCKKITSTALLQNENLLAQVFSILVTAHYQTSANDLKMLLDSPLVHLLVIFKQDQVLAVSLLLAEGHRAKNKVSVSDILAVKNSEKRLRNQLLPQSLFSHCGIEQAFDFSYFRVLRIAVHPQLQQRGIGSYFIEKISQYSVEQGVDFIGSSFGANSSLLSFWLKADFHLAHIGFTHNKASGEHSALVLSPLSAPAKIVQQQLTDLFYRSFDHLLVDEYQQLNVSLVQLILRHCPKENLTLLTEHDRGNINAFAKGERMYSNCVYSLYLWLKYQLIHNENSTDKELLLFIERVMQKHSISAICEKYNLAGKKALNNYLQVYVNKKGSHSCP